MALKSFEINGLGKCLVGTYTIRHLTKYFQCSPENLLFIGSQAGMEYEFNSYLLKFSHENFLIQSKGAAGLKEKAIEEIDSLLDEHPLTPKDFEVIVDSLCMSVYGMTRNEFIDKIKAATEAVTENAESDDLKKNTIGTSTGEELTKSVGVTE